MESSQPNAYVIVDNPDDQHQAPYSTQEIYYD